RSTPDELESALRYAIDIGYRHIDTASLYENEEIIGSVVADLIHDRRVSRKDLFITTKKGLARAIGLSNFNVEQLQQIYHAAKVKPHNLQIEVHVHFPQRELHTLCTSLNISVTAYAPLGCPSKRGTGDWPQEVAIDDPIVVRLAEKYGKTPAQILLRHLIQRQIIVIPKSTNRERLRENFNVR
uniref:NADP-dependent oxidoreductase domain-containing protein n=1 Tax=Parascaris equorum TaxID=6256 RepID=A0A914RTZ0_PAREQ